MSARTIGKTDLLIALGVFVLALGLRAGYLSEIVDLPEFDRPAVDAGYHDYWAWGLASGEWPASGDLEDPHFDSTPFFKPPLCPYFLAAVYRMFGHNYLAARIIQMLIGSASCVLGYWLGRRLFGRVTGAVCGAMMAGYWGFVYFDSELREIVLLVFLHLLLICGLLELRRRPTALGALACGAVLGLAALGKPNSLLFVPVAAVWLAMVLRRTLPARRRAALAGCLVGGTLVTVAPATIRNAVAAKDFVLISSNGGINLYIGNNPTSSGFSVRLPEPIPVFGSSFDYPKIVRYVEGVEQRDMKYSEVSGYFVDRALDHLRAAPGHCAALALRKAVLFWGGLEVASERDLNSSRQESFVLANLPGNFGALFAFGAVGAAMALGRRPSGRRRRLGLEPGAGLRADRADMVLVLLLVATYFVSFLPFFVTARYRAPIIPFMVVFAAHAVVQIVRFGQRGRFVAVGVAAAAVVVLYLVNGIDFYGLSRSVTRGAFKAKYDRGVAYYQHGRLDEAVAAYREALEINPNFALAHNNLGIALAAQRKTSEAVEQYEEALRLVPDYPEAHNNLGKALVLLGDVDGAVAHYQAALALQPDSVTTRRNLAEALETAGKPDEAVTQYEQLLLMRPDDADTCRSLGMLLAAQDRMEAAADYFRKDVLLRPDDADAHNNLGAALARLGRIDAAIGQFREALRIDPHHPQAKLGLTAALAQKRGN